MKAVWQVTRLAEVCKTAAGGTPLKSNKEFYEGGKIPWLQSGEVSQGEISAAKTFITELGLKKSSAKLFPANTVLVAMYGATAGQVGILRFESATNQAVCGILPNKTFIPEFLYYLLLSRKSELVAQAVGNAQPNISQQKIRDMYVPLVTIPEQRRIVSTLAQAFGKIAKARANAKKNLQNSREVFESYLNSLFIRKGEGWLEKPLNELCEFKHGFAFKSEYFSTKGDYILLSPGNFHERGGYKDRGGKQKYYEGAIPAGYILAEGDLLIAMTEQAAGLLGSPILVPKVGRFLHNQRLGLVAAKNGAPWCNEFFFHVFNTQRVRKEIHDSASGVKVRHTSPSKMGDVVVPFPANTAEQLAIVQKINALAKETQRLESIYKKKLAALDELKQSLLHQAFSGQL
ncbi:restriction endonuclease subunit S [Stutzerimonas stutzeri]|uniref:restriction endonuclease subunit S n=1 Tax=Stutzerimonas stutzeri TaxID=316 RepID=UPI0009B996EE|nr:restriction endonuclease subunit S [Stutzerimonas stutzeri]